MDPTALRLMCFILALLLFGMLEWAIPWASAPSLRHKGINLGIGLIDAVLLKVLTSAFLVWIALAAYSRDIGLLNRIPLHPWSRGLLAIIILDFIIYGQHVAFHYVPLLWRIHRVHHSDPSLDVTSGVRFHPVEMVLSLLLKAVAVILIGAPATAVLIFEIILNTSSVFSHANLRLAAAPDRLMRWLIVTPGMHRVHHSAVQGELNHNFGFNLSIWDRLFGTYLASSAAGEFAIPIGLPGQRIRQPGLIALLLMPFKRDG